MRDRYLPRRPRRERVQAIPCSASPWPVGASFADHAAKPIATRRRDAQFEFLLHPLRVSAQWQGTTNCPRMRYADPDPWPTRHFLNRFVPQPAGTPMAVLWARHERIGFEMVKKSIEHSIASGRWGNPFTRAVINEPAEPRLHAPV